ncbi:MAG: hypothetical protein KUG79_15700 [Pseudomonadales bacterium]|nr:hypothetical protein [Pseudomonadales bacterium]
MKNTKLSLIATEGEAGVYRRRIQLVSTHNSAWAELEDDFHHFRIEFQHDGKKILATAGSAPRPPWVTCIGALTPLKLIEGMPIAESSVAVHGYTDARQQCTHIFDLAGMLIAQIARGEGQREYRFTVPDRIDGCTSAIAQQDGEQILRFDISGFDITAPELFAGQTLQHGGFSRWAKQKFAPSETELAIALHRVATISFGRPLKLDQLKRAAEFKAVARNACHSFSDAVIDKALRVHGSQRNHNQVPTAWPVWPDPLSEVVASVKQ